MPVSVRILGLSPHDAIPGWVLDVSGSAVKLGLPRAVPCGSPVRIEGDDMLLLGEICRCGAEGELYGAAVQIRHCLSGLAQLERLNAALLGRKRPAEKMPALEPVERD